jgi:trimeric autotransporter adhesin
MHLRHMVVMPIALSLAACADGGTASHVAAVPAASHATAPVAAGSPARRGVKLITTVGCSNDSSDQKHELNLAGSAGAANGQYAFVANGYNLGICGDYSAIGGGDSNAVTTNYAVIGGGVNNTVGIFGDHGIIAGGNANDLGGSYAAIGGGSNNVIDDGTAYSTIAGGDANEVSTQSTGGDSAIGGGSHNGVSSQYAVIAGGFTNTVSGDYGFIGAGTNNTVSAAGGFIASGGYNTVSALGAVVDGGYQQTASGSFSTIPGGYRNATSGTYALAAGAFANAGQNGTFVWSDGSNGSAVLSSSHAYQFLARASGGFTLYTNAGATVGAQLPAGSGTWESLSDRNAKTNIVPLDDETVLDKVAALPISRWSYRTEHGVRHAGPMAQDFYAAFGLGEDDKHITSIDENGVALAAIKALHRENVQLRAANGRIERELDDVRAAVRVLERRAVAPQTPARASRP